MRSTGARLAGFKLRRVTMRATVMALTICLGVPAAAVGQEAKVTKGAEVYTAQKCSLCHSIGDKGNKKGPLDDVGSKLSVVEIRQWITDAKTMTEKSKATRKPPMKSYTVPAEDLDALVAYMASLKKK
jgi:mono/diheme cytochrome c family protein